MSFYNFIRNELDGGDELHIDGEIVCDLDWWGPSGQVVARRFRQRLNQCKDVTVYINSPGGDVFAAAEIYTALREHKGRVTVKITGIAASAASVIAMAGDEVLMSPVAYMMVHDPWTYAAGNYREMEHQAAILKEIGEGLIAAYTAKTGKTRDEIAAALGSADVAATAEQCGKLMRLLATDPQSDVRLANSVWMRPDAQFEQPFVDAMRDQFYASLFLADFGTDTADKAMAQWIADNTEGTLNPTFESQEGQLLSLIDTVYFKSEWAKAFDAEATEPGMFAAEGGAMQAAFMAQRLDRPQEIRQTETYTRASLGFMDGSEMTFVLPAEGKGVQDLLADGALLEEAFAGETTGEAFVTYRVPKFGFDSSYGLIPALERLGITAAFGDWADFSNLSRTPAYVSSVAQESHIGLDENGVEASAYTKVDIMEMSALPDPSVIGELELNLNRPFLYEIRTRQGIPLFIGVCTQPDEAA